MFRRIGAALRRFMYGRYGSDQLNMAILVAAVLVSLTNSVLTVFLRESTVYSGIVAPILSVIVYGLLIYSFFRMFSRNIYKRQRENRRFTQLWMRLKDRNNRYFRCPNCKQTVRVPRGRGKICIRCPKCGEKFTRKT
jgi:DNA-directed RNA polymerase subunit RPC12/RpoP